jgi:hypothetical protein
MATPKSQEELLADFKAEVQDNAPDLTDWTEGSINDVLGGVVSSGIREVELLAVDSFRKTFFDTADGPEVTQGTDDLQALAVDHFGDDFARPGATFGLGDVTFSRPTAAAGSITILAGTIVKTLPDATGTSQRFATLVDEVMGVGVLTINASVLAVIAGAAGNAQSMSITVIETALADPTITVINSLDFVGGGAALTDVEYREFIKNKIQTLKGATLAAIQAAALAVAGVESATPLETQLAVIEYDIATNAIKVGASYFYIPNAILYIADANGTASAGLLTLVQAAVDAVRAAGVRVKVSAAVAQSLNWTAAVVLNIGGPNYASLSVSTAPIRQVMANYVNAIPTGTGFVRASANAAMLAVYGPAGTNDITSFGTSTPVSDVAGSTGVKLIAGTMATT